MRQLPASKCIAFEEGVNAFYLDNPDCKYRPTSHYYREFCRGYNFAFFKNKDEHVQSIPARCLRQV